jgi:ribulose-phosphate 3-epimerase
VADASPSSTAFARLASLAPTLSVGVLTADLLALGADVARLEGTGVGMLHVDVMDGCFTPMMTFGPPIVKALPRSFLKDAHLMIRDPLEKLDEYVAAGADVVTIHAESCTHVHRVLQRLGAMQNANDPTRGIVRGLALNPGTPLEVLPPLLDEVDLVLLLAINPGWGGQKFLPSTMGRIATARRLLDGAGRRLLLAADGGITRENVGRLAGTGVDVVVTGSAVFDGKAPAENARAMLAALRAG